MMRMNKDEPPVGLQYCHIPTQSTYTKILAENDKDKRHHLLGTFPFVTTGSLVAHPTVCSALIESVGVSLDILSLIVLMIFLISAWSTTHSSTWSAWRSGSSSGVRLTFISLTGVPPAMVEEGASRCASSQPFHSQGGDVPP
jgi:hypothetical protein